MNYRHAFHAGNHGDVLKHAVLARVLSYLTQKEAALSVLDAHAGIGIYDLGGLEALKTGEWRGGIGKLLAADLPAAITQLMSPYLNLVKALNGDGVLRHYPGSPALTQALLRAQDRLLLNELHPLDREILRANYSADRRVTMLGVDAEQAVKSQLPFREKRGLVLIDPAFEVTDEALRVQRMLTHALRRMAQVCVMIWYPVTTQDYADALCDGLDVSGAKAALRAEVLVRPAMESGGLAGSGVVVVNPPWILFDELDAMLPELARALGEDGGGTWNLQWLKQGT